MCAADRLATLGVLVHDRKTGMLAVVLGKHPSEGSQGKTKILLHARVTCALEDLLNQNMQAYWEKMSVYCEWSFSRPFPLSTSQTHNNFLMVFTQRRHAAREDPQQRTVFTLNIACDPMSLHSPLPHTWVHSSAPSCVVAASLACCVRVPPACIRAFTTRTPPRTPRGRGRPSLPPPALLGAVLLRS